ncbi:ExeA family protein [Sphingomonas sp. FW199]|uniref:ExeA family protein n=1 Tax=Sphingomonas sp. FW199 TaxID=3400217 RepID=UPI003CFAAD4F
MYDVHYGLSGRPFQLTPDPAFWFDTGTHRKAMAYLGYGLSQGEGFVVITGEPGTGKTTLVAHLLATADVDQLHVVRIVTTQVDAADLLHLVADGLGAETRGLAKSDVLKAIERALHGVARAGKRTLLIVDESQSLPVDSLEELRMLSNFQAGGYPLLQILLLGQPEFRELLTGSGRLEQLRQRVIAMHHLTPMEPEEVGPYLAHRLACVGWTGRPDFEGEAIAAMFAWSGGIPRRLNQLASRVLLYGAVEGIDRFTDRHIADVVADLDADARPAAAPAAAPVPAAPPVLPVEAPVVAAPVAAMPDPAILDRLTAMEARLEEQEAALRRVLTLLVDWIEADQRRGEPAPIHSNAA